MNESTIFDPDFQEPPHFYSKTSFYRIRKAILFCRSYNVKIFELRKEPKYVPEKKSHKVARNEKTYFRVCTVCPKLGNISKSLKYSIFIVLLLDW